MRLAFTLLGFATLAAAGDPDPNDLLERARSRIRANATHLTRYSCTQSIRRESRKHTDPLWLRASCEDILAARADGRGPKLRQGSWDRMKLDVILSEGTETHSWPQGGAVDRGEMELMTARGSFGTGDFGAFPISILAERNAVIEFERWDGGAAVYRYRVARAASRYAIDVGGRTEIAGYSGELRIDAATARLARLRVVTDVLPRESGSCSAATTVEFDPAAPALLPRRTVLESLSAEAFESTNIVEYAGCREFTAESTVRFDLPAPGADADVGRPLALPAGKRVWLRLDREIDSSKAAGGDRVTATVRTTVKSGREVVLPAGAVLKGRIVHFEQEYMPMRGFWLLLVFDEAEVGGVSHPIHLRPPANAPPQLGRLPSYPLGTEGPPQVGRFWFGGMDPLVLRKGFESVWETADPPPSAR